MLILADTGILLRLVDPIEPMRPAIEAKILDLETHGDEIVTSHQNQSSSGAFRRGPRRHAAGTD